MRVRLTVFLLGLAMCACVQAQKPTDVEFLNSGKVIPKSLPFSEAVRVGDTLYLSGQIGIVPGNLFSASGAHRDCVRLSCAVLWEPRIEQALAQLGRLAHG